MPYGVNNMNSEFKIDRPIFIVGCGRSGTTILYRLLCGHPVLAWFSNYSEKWPMYPQFALLSSLYKVDPLRRRRPKGLPVPTEGHNLWDYCKPVLDSPSDPPLMEEDVTLQDAAQIKKMIMLHMHYQRKPRFINKNTRNTRRIRFLHEIFKDALFIHIIRNPQATVASFLNVDFWPDLKIWSHDKITPNEWAAQGGDPVELAARLWVAEVQRALNDKAVLPQDQYLEIHYEDLMENSKDILSAVLAFSGLEWNNQFDKFFNTFSLKNMNHKFKTEFNQHQLNTIESVVAPLAESLGYMSSPEKPQ